LKKTVLIILNLFFVLLLGKAQNWQWSKNFPNPDIYVNYWFYRTQGLITDNKGQVYSYGAKTPYSNPLNDTVGSIFHCFDPNGNLIFKKHWKIPFYIQKMEYDGTANFYFAAVFYGNQTIDGVSISSQGDMDGVIGKMDLHGTVLWMKTFGGPGMDVANGLCFNPSDNCIYLTGSIKDTLFLNNSFYSINPQSSIIIKCSPLGEIQTLKLYGSSGKFRNAGMEICHNNSGNLIALIDRSSNRLWSSDPGNGPTCGRYVVKFDSNLDTIWTKYIIGPECYYGWACGEMRVSKNDDIYLTRNCSGKYGGDEELLRLDGKSGSIKWSHPNRDGNYSDVYIDSTTVFVVGNEGADGCPCPGNNSGYGVIKKFSDNNLVLGETRTAIPVLSRLTMDNTGNIYVSGSYGNKSIVLGNDTLQSDSVYVNGYWYYGTRFLSKLTDINCTPININGYTHHPWARYICPGQTITLTADSGCANYLWSNGDALQQTQISSSGVFYVTTHEETGCTAYSTPLTVEVKQNNKPQEICVVTYNIAIGKYEIVSTMTDYATAYYKIYKEVKPGYNALIDTVLYSTSQYLCDYKDHSSFPDSVSQKYFISTVDTCGSESPLGTGHKPVRLVVSTDSSQRLLQWNAYEGLSGTKYYIYRGISVSTLSLYDSVSISTLSYADKSTSQNYFYQIRMKLNHGCWNGNAGVFFSLSNIAPRSNHLLSNDELNGNSFGINIFPNPSSGKFNVESSEKISSIIVTNLLGEVVYSQNGSFIQFPIDLSNRSKGIYFVEIISGNARSTKKIVLE
jgi:hypothetical protein